MAHGPAKTHPQQTIVAYTTKLPFYRSEAMECVDHGLGYAGESDLNRALFGCALPVAMSGVVYAKPPPGRAYMSAPRSLLDGVVHTEKHSHDNTHWIM